MRYECFDCVTGRTIGHVDRESAAIRLCNRHESRTGHTTDYEIANQVAVSDCRCRCGSTVCCTCGDW